MIKVKDINDGSRLIRLVGKEKDSPEVQELLTLIKENDSAFMPIRPQEKDIHSIKDQWVNYNSPVFGINLETVYRWLACISFSIARGLYYMAEEERLYEGVLPDGLHNCRTRDQAHGILGKPVKQTNDTDQYPPDNDVILGFLHDYDDTGKLLTTSYGTSKVLSNPRYLPNRFSPVMESLRDVPNDLED